MLSKGKILIAEPTLNDPTFSRSVILLCEHNSEGSIGFVVNKKLSINVQDAIKKFPKKNVPVYLGGPVQQNSLFFIHPYGDLIQESKYITNDLYWGGMYNQLHSYLKKDLIDIRKIHFYIGYSGWVKGQLKQELKEKSWIVEDFDISEFYTDSSPIWKKRLMNMDDKRKIWANTPDNFTLN